MTRGPDERLHSWVGLFRRLRVKPQELRFSLQRGGRWRQRPCLCARPVTRGASGGFLCRMPAIPHCSAPSTLPGRLPCSPGSSRQRQPSMPIPENPHFRSKGDRQHDPMLSAWPERSWSDSWSSPSWHGAACKPAHPQLLQACPGCSGVLGSVPAPHPAGARSIPRPPLWQPKVSLRSAEDSLWDKVTLENYYLILLRQGR